MASRRRSSSVWKGSLSFGLLNIPVSLQTAQEDKELHFHTLDEKNKAPIHYKKVNAETGQEVPYDRIVKAYEYKKGEYVIVSDEDLKSANPKATQTIDIEDFVPLEDIDLLMFEKPYYLLPQKDGEKGYFLLRDALEKTKKVAIARVVLRTKMHLCALMPMGDYLILEMLRFAHEVKQVHEVDFLKGIKKPKYSPKEMHMAEALIKDMTAKWDPDKYKDTYYDDVMMVIKEKARYGANAPVRRAEIPEIEPTNVTDLLPLLRKSLEEKKQNGKRNSRNARHMH